MHQLKYRRSCNVLTVDLSDSIISSIKSACRKYSTLLESFVNWEQKGIPKSAGLSNSKDFDLNRMRKLLGGLGNPHLSWPAVHVAGSKGKGSTVALISSVLRSAGYKVGVYMSPHMHHISERISTDMWTHLRPESFEALVQNNSKTLEHVQQAEGGALSHFEAVTGLAYRHFADEKVDIGVIETGLGGLTDATNVIDEQQLQLAVITSLGYEHVDALGGSIQSIAAAKAGILKRGRPVVLSRQQHEEALQVVLEHAHHGGCEVLRAEQMVQVKHHSYSVDPLRLQSSAIEHLHISGPDGIELEACSSLIGAHQHDNIATAVTCLCKLRGMGWAISDQHISLGIERARLPGRFQVMCLQSPGEGRVLGTITSDTNSSPPSPQRYVVLDGAHTRESASALTSTLRVVFPSEPIVLVIAMASDKEHRAVIEEMRKCGPKAVVFTSTAIAGSSDRSCAPGVLASHWQVASMTSSQPMSYGRCRQLIQASLPAAIDKAKHELSGHGPGGIICVTGSLHAAAEAERFLTR
ncbi:hypothetical protein CEUSTIGMA_g2993.t1 [Chlamydomonas eustigma]|uniref:Uncharacterized protein n=1 Tax=Chlamydomonas eustigma TaxID=1157962 RepID=A0A250WYG9_9CHLO|nr:hypothetical protein CEUSTIGMA_g2993.t1 [Chlamydomonas eustigma]|eukprot:GAX75550.1 hypothetical protein CEUSTIGMA_g2993.t1 [Chlamydomonas eustigma]